MVVPEQIVETVIINVDVRHRNLNISGENVLPVRFRKQQQPTLEAALTTTPLPETNLQSTAASMSIMSGKVHSIFTTATSLPIIGRSTNTNRPETWSCRTDPSSPTTHLLSPTPRSHASLEPTTGTEGNPNSLFLTKRGYHPRQRRCQAP